VSAATSRGLEYAFLIMLVPLALNGILLLFVPRRSYPTDVATALATERSAVHAAGPAPRSVRDRPLNNNDPLLTHRPG
jgi:hypothetical protein